MAGNSLAQRVLTALVAVAILLPAFLLLPKSFGLVLMALFVLGAAWEWSAFSGLSRRAGRLAYVGVIAALIVVAERLVPSVVAVGGIALASMLWWAVALVGILRFPVSIAPLTTACCGVLVLLPAWVSMAALLGTQERGRTLLLLVLAIVCAADVGAFFTGRRFGRVKLAVRVSPGKTWEGVLGGATCAALVAVAGAAFLGRPLAPAVSFGISLAAMSVVGDLTVSMFKRNAGIKDSGNLFPGHGGVLDRVDGLTAAAPLFVLLGGWLGWLGP
jgi:phosphatidate cytidylyltransferase